MKALVFNTVFYYQCHRFSGRPDEEYVKALRNIQQLFERRNCISKQLAESFAAMRYRIDSFCQSIVQILTQLGVCLCRTDCEIDFFHLLLIQNPEFYRMRDFLQL